MMWAWDLLLWLGLIAGVLVALTFIALSGLALWAVITAIIETQRGNRK
jgi:hypothetical protein